MIWLVVSLLTVLGGGLAILAGMATRWIAIAIAAFSVIAAAVFHSNLADPMEAISFWKNLGLAGGLLMLAAHGPGPLSLDARVPGRGLVTSH